MAFVVFNLLAAAALIGIDQAIKLWATNVLQPIGAMPLIPHVVELRFVLNPGMAFSLLSGKHLFLIVCSTARWWTTSICCSCSLRCSILRISACVWAWASGCW